MGGRLPHQAWSTVDGHAVVRVTRRRAAAGDLGEPERLERLIKVERRGTLDGKRVAYGGTEELGAAGLKRDRRFGGRVAE